jgi:hypothetical protein
MVFFTVVENLARERFVEHVGVVAKGHHVRVGEGYEFWVYDWPADSENDDRSNADCTRRFSCAAEYSREKRKLAGLVFAWPTSLPLAAWQDWCPLFYEKARDILETVLGSYPGNRGIHSLLYMLHPSNDPSFCPDPSNPLETFFRGSCVGFVEYCYESAGLTIVDPEKIPSVDRKEVLGTLAAGRYFLSLHRDAMADDATHPLFEGDFPVRLFFPGYQLAALRGGFAVPLTLSLADAGFTAP